MSVSVCCELTHIPLFPTCTSRFGYSIGGARRSSAAQHVKDHTIMVIGAPLDDDGVSGRGAAFVYDTYSYNGENGGVLGGCDDGNMMSGDGCDNFCLVESGHTCVDDVNRLTWCAAVFPGCGNGVPELPVEVCDDGNLVDSDGCASDCLSVEVGFECVVGYTPVSASVCAAVCGDGMMVGPELCDDGNTVDNDGCSGNCSAVAICGDGGVDNVFPATEVCDDGNTIEDDGCSADCSTTERCGDGRVDGGGTLLEVCDDGNTVTGDGCPVNCLFWESGWNCTQPPGGLSLCTASACGDSLVAGVEECDPPKGDGSCTDQCVRPPSDSPPPPPCIDLQGFYCATTLEVTVGGGSSLLVLLVVVAAVVVCISRGGDGEKTKDLNQFPQKKRRGSVLSHSREGNPDGLTNSDMAFVDLPAPTRPKSIESGMTAATASTTVTTQINRIVEAMDNLDIETNASSEAEADKMTAEALKMLERAEAMRTR